MIVEVTGPTGVGKSTFLKALINKLNKGHYPTGAVLEHRFNFSSEIPESLSDLETHNIQTDLLVLPYTLKFLSRNLRFFWFCLLHILHDTCSFHEKLNLARSFTRKAGIRAFLTRLQLKHLIVCVDEGLMHTAHNILVSPTHLAPSTSIDDFLRVCPPPDLLIVLMDSPETLLGNLNARGNLSPRVRGTEDLACFVENASELYSSVINSAHLPDNTIIIHQPLAQLDEALNFCVDKIDDCWNKHY